jgi:hypothetical protein
VRPSGIQRVNGLVVGTGRLASMSPPWPLLVFDLTVWLKLLPDIHQLNETVAALEGDRVLEARERERGAVVLRCVENGVRPSPDDHPFLALRLLCEPGVVSADGLEEYAFRLSECYPGAAAEPFFLLDCRDGVLHLVEEVAFLGDLVGPGMLSTTAPAAWLADYSAQLIGRHQRELVS